MYRQMGMTDWLEKGVIERTGFHLRVLPVDHLGHPREGLAGKRRPDRFRTGPSASSASRTTTREVQPVNTFHYL